MTAPARPATSSNSAGLVRFEITQGHLFMLDKPVPAMPVTVSRWAICSWSI